MCDLQLVFIEWNTDIEYTNIVKKFKDNGINYQATAEQNYWLVDNKTKTMEIFSIKK